MHTITLATLAASFLPLLANVVVATVLATLGVADLYRARQARRFRVVVYPCKATTPRRRYRVPARGAVCTPTFVTATGRRMATVPAYGRPAVLA